jgi:tetratricopeptide (TPR) repeat protein
MPKLVTLAICAFLVLYGTAYASAPPDITSEEVALLPTYCPYTQSFKPGISMGANNHPKAQAWLNTIGPSFWHLHHYCWALIQINRAEKLSTPEQLKNGYRKSAIGNMDYVIRNSPADLVLLPEIYTWIGRMELKLKQPEQARNSFEKAKSSKVDYWPAYYHWAEHLYSTNDHTEALRITIDGLSHAPKSKPLIKLLEVLEKKSRQIASHE